MKIKYLILGIILCSSFVLAGNFNFSTEANFTTNIYEVLGYNYTCALDNNTYYGSVVYNNTLDFSRDFDFVINNSNRTHKLYFTSIDESFVKLNFQSNYLFPERVKFSFYNESYTFWVQDDDIVYIPITIYDRNISWSEFYNSSLNASVIYEVIDYNETGETFFDLLLKNDIELIHIKEDSTAKVRDLLLEKLIVTTKIPIRSVNITSTKKISSRHVISGKDILIYITPEEVGDHIITYNVTDYFGNSEVLESNLLVEPIDIVFFYSLNIPSLAVGERSKLIIYEAPALVKVNYTLVSIDFVVDNSTLYNASNSTKIDLYLSDEGDSSYFLEVNKTVSITRLKTYLNILPMNYGHLTLIFKVDTPSEIQSNSDFVVRASIGNYSIFDKQEFNVAGVKVVCDLSDANNLNNATRKCYAEFPVNGNVESALIVLQERDFIHYQQSHANELEYQKTQSDAEIKNRENWLGIFVILATVLLGSLIWVLIPKDWLVIRVKSEK